MLRWHEALIVAVFAGIIIFIIFVVILVRRNSISKRSCISTETPSTDAKRPTFPSQPEVNTKRRPNTHFFRRGSSTKSFFDWADHPELITGAVENGWSQFSFTSCVPVSVRSSLFRSLRVTGDYHTSRDSCSSNNTNIVDLVDESWEIGPGSVEFMQTITFKTKGGINGCSGTAIVSSSSVAIALVKMSLPLPGPPVVQSFPQEAYFEIIVMNSSEDDGKFTGEGEKTKLLIQRNFSSSADVGKSQEGLFHVSSSRGSHLIEDFKLGGGGRRGSRGGGGAKVSIGLSVGGFTSTRIPGSYPGSIGFNSDGSVFLSGMKLVFESGKEDWAKTGKVIGCGFDPTKKTVYFTVDSELVHVIHCKSEDFGAPLYPVLATNVDITMLVNLGQSSFSYPPANSHRTPNPCFIGPVVKSSEASLGYEESRELFSMGRLDAEWLSHSATTKSTVSNSCNLYSYNKNSNMDEYEIEPEAEFIEIVLDSTGR